MADFIKNETNFKKKFFQKNIYLLVIILIILLSCLVVCWFIYWHNIKLFFLEGWALLRNKDVFCQYINSYGIWAPLAFIFFQIFQVFISPIPGELVGVVGGYIFGWFFSFIYSTIGLSLGSWINFFAARLIGKTFVERMISLQHFANINFFMKRQGILVALILFIIPGFPKDYLCYILGLAQINWRIFMIISSLGRIPGTIMLSLQGAAVFQEDYRSFFYLFAFSLIFVLPIYIWRNSVYYLLLKWRKANFLVKKRNEFRDKS